MYASVHADRSARVLVSADHSAAGLGRLDPTPIVDAIPLPEGARLVTLAREAVAIGRDGRPHPLGRDRMALGAILPPGYVRLLAPAYRDDPAARALDPLPYAAVAAGASGEPLVAAAKIGEAHGARDRDGGRTALRAHPANALARQLARCAHDNACGPAGAALGHGELPVPLGAPLAERPRLPVALRSGYPGAPTEAPAFRPSAQEVAEVAGTHLASGGTGIAFGRACDGEPLGRVRVIEDAVAMIRTRHPGATVGLETAGSEVTALRRAMGSGVTRVSVRIGSARSDTYARLHGPIAHRWTDVRACLQAAAERSGRLTIALLVLPGLTDRSAEIDAIAGLLGELPGGTLELRDLGCDPLRTLAAFPRREAEGIRALLARLSEADHFRTGATEAPLVAARV